MIFSTLFQRLCILLALITVDSLFVLGQPSHWSKTPISQACLTADKKLLAYANLTDIVVVNLQTFQEVNKIPIDIEKIGVINELQFNPGNEDMLVFRGEKWNGDYSRLLFMSYPNDSIYGVYYKENKRQFALPGQAFLAMSNDFSRYFFAFNETFSYEYGNKTNFGTQAGGMRAFPDKRDINLTGKLLSMATTKTGDRLVNLYYDSTYQKKERFTIEVIETIGYKVLLTKQIELPLLVTPRLEISEEGNVLQIECRSRIGRRFEYRRISDLELVEGFVSFNIRGRVVNGFHAIKKDSDYLGYKMGDTEPLWNLWSNLSDLFTIDDLFLLNEKDVIVFGPKEGENGFGKGEGYGFQKLNLEELSMFTKRDKTEKEMTFYDPKALIVQNSTLRERNLMNGYLSMVQSPSGNYFYLIAGKELEIWDGSSKKRLYKLTFDLEIKAYPDGNDDHLLILEKVNGKSYRDFRAHILEVKTGKTRTKDFMDQAFDFFNPDYKCDCYPDPSLSDTWLCSDYSSALWRMTEEKGVPTEVYRVDDGDDIVQLEMVAVPNSSQWMVKEFRRKGDTEFAFKETHWLQINKEGLVETKTDRSQLGPAVQKDVFLKIESEAIVFTNAEGKTLFSQKKRKEDKLEALDVYNDRVYLILEDNSWDSARLVVVDWNTDPVASNHRLPRYTTQFFADKNGLIYINDDRLWYYETSSRFHVALTPETKGFFQERDFSMNQQGQVFLKRIHIDMTTLEIKPTAAVTLNSILLQGERLGQVLYVESTNSFDKSRPYYQFHIAYIDSVDKPIWSSDKKYFKNKPILQWFSANFHLSYDRQSVWIQRDLGMLDEPEDNQSYRLDLSTLKLKNFANPSFEETVDFHSGRVNANRFLVFPYSYSITVVDSKNQRVGDEVYYAREYLKTVYYDSLSNRIFGGSTIGKLFVWEVGKPSPLQIINCFDSEIAAIQTWSDKLVLYSTNGQLKVLNRTSLEEILSFEYTEEDKKNHYAWFTPDGYYRLDKWNLNNYHFVQNFQTFPVKSYEKFYHRPDILLDRMGYAGSSTHRMYDLAFKARVKSTKGTISGLSSNNSTGPVLQRKENQAYFSVTKERILELQLNLKKGTQSLSRLLVRSNGSLIQTMDLKSFTSSEIRVPVELIVGKNMLEVTVEDVSGNMSDVVEFWVECQAKSEQRLFFAGVGVNRYQEPSHELKYAQDDVEWLERVFKNRYDSAAQTRLLLNEEAKRSTILEWKKWLVTSKPDDIVVLAFSGHGLLDSTNQFYFATHDVQFNNPAVGGLSYAELKGLLEDIPARRKLILLDACHSGLVAENELTTQVEAKPTTTKGFFKGEQSKFNLEASFKYMQLLFTDMDASSGVVVISAAGGQEKAYETDRMGGVFTNSFLKAFERGLTISEVQRKTNEYVREYSEGKQTPTAREENVLWDWTF